MTLLENRFINRVLHKALWATVLPLCAVWGLGQAVTQHLAPTPTDALPLRSAPAELPLQWDGAPLRPLALSAVEQRFARHFPGSVVRLTDGRQCWCCAA